MDITTIQFMDETFDAVVDKGGLDALMEPQLGPKLGIQYLSEVMRILKSGGKFICLTLAESHVLGTLCSFLLPCFLILVHISIPFSNVSVLTHLLRKSVINSLHSYQNFITCFFLPTYSLK